jgi:hypothetical protein
MKTCVISLQVQTEVYYRLDPKFSRIDRLEHSLSHVGYQGDFIAWRGEYPPGCPDHLESPFGFKACAMQHARTAGYDSALWLDSSAVAIRPLKSWFQEIDENGWAFFGDEKHFLGEWCSDEVLDYFRIPRDSLMCRAELFGGAMGLNFHNAKANNFLDSWVSLAKEGFAFRGTMAPVLTLEGFEAVKWNKDQIISRDSRVKGHRHDQTVAGILSFQLGMPASKRLVTFSYQDAYHDPNLAVIFERDLAVTLRRIHFRLWIKQRLKAFGIFCMRCAQRS